MDYHRDTRDDGRKKKKEKFPDREGKAKLQTSEQQNTEGM